MRRTLLLLLLVTGCVRGLGPDREDPVRVEDLEAVFTPGDRGEVALSLQVDNPANLPATLSSIQWEVWLGNRWFAAGTQNVGVALPPESTQPVKVVVPIVFRRERAPEPGPTAVELGVRGAVVVQSPAGEWRHHFEERRTMEVRNAPSMD